MPTFFRIAEEGGTGNRDQRQSRSKWSESYWQMQSMHTLLSLLFNAFHLLRSSKTIDLFRAFNNPFACYVTSTLMFSERFVFFFRGMDAHAVRALFMTESKTKKDRMTFSKSIVVYQLLDQKRQQSSVHSLPNFQAPPLAQRAYCPPRNSRGGHRRGDSNGRKDEGGGWLSVKRCLTPLKLKGLFCLNAKCMVGMRWNDIGVSIDHIKLRWLNHRATGASC